MEDRTMSPRFWIVAGCVVLSAAVAGYGLGGFAGGQFEGGVLAGRSAEQSASPESPAEESDTDIGQAASKSSADEPPEKIVCRGCGPTLAERQMTEAAYATAANDPILQDYEAGDGMTTAQMDDRPPVVVATVGRTLQAPPHLLGTTGEEFSSARE
jgi:hypothetical protein